LNHTTHDTTTRPRVEFVGQDPDGSLYRGDFDELFRNWTRLRPRMDEEQIRVARGFEKMERAFRQNCDELAIYRYEASGPEGQAYWYVLGLTDDGVSGLTEYYGVSALGLYAFEP
jgi:hypothetical protein